MLHEHATELLGFAAEIEKIGKAEVAKGDPEARGESLTNAAFEIRDAVQGE